MLQDARSHGLLRRKNLDQLGGLLGLLRSIGLGLLIAFRLDNAVEATGFQQIRVDAAGIVRGFLAEDSFRVGLDPAQGNIVHSALVGLECQIILVDLAILLAADDLGLEDQLILRAILRLARFDFFQEEVVVAFGKGLEVGADFGEVSVNNW